MKGLNLSDLTTEKRNPDTMNLDEMTVEEIVAVMNNEDCKVVETVRKVLPQVSKIIKMTTESLENNGRIIYIGAGTSGRLGYWMRLNVRRPLVWTANVLSD